MEGFWEREDRFDDEMEAWAAENADLVAEYMPDDDKENRLDEKDEWRHDRL